MEGGPGGSDIQFEISSENLDDVVAVSNRIEEELRGYAGVYDIEDDFDISVPLNILPDVNTVGDLAQKLQELNS